MVAINPALDNRSTVVTIEQWRESLEKILQHYADIPYRYGDITTYVIVSRDRNHYLLMHEGWEKSHRVHGTIVHAEIRDEKIWIHYDGIEEGITDELIATGVPKTCIVLAFQPPDVRSHTEYGVA
jgi:XisI protein